MHQNTRMLVITLLTTALLTACAAPAQPDTARPPAPPAARVATARLPQAAAITIANVGLQSPESVLLDPQADSYLVSNINGSPFAQDNNGFISQIAPDGHVLNLKWIAGGVHDVTLNAPKGMALVGASLYIADLTVVRRFDRQTGQPQGAITVPGATFLNDLVAAPDGTLYVSDTGLQATAAGFTATGSDAIYQISPGGDVRAWVKSPALGNPNGLALRADGTLMANTLNASREYYALAQDGSPRNTRKLPGGQLDGLVTLPDGSLLLSSWETNTIYRVGSDGQASSIYTNAASPSADIGYDTQRALVLIPLFSTNEVVLLPYAQ